MPHTIKVHLGWDDSITFVFGKVPSGIPSLLGGLGIHYTIANKSVRTTGFTNHSALQFVSDHLAELPTMKFIVGARTAHPDDKSTYTYWVHRGLRFLIENYSTPNTLPFDGVVYFYRFNVQQDDDPILDLLRTGCPIHQDEFCITYLVDDETDTKLILLGGSEQLVRVEDKFKPTNEYYGITEDNEYLFSSVHRHWFNPRFINP